MSRSWRPHTLKQVTILAFLWLVGDGLATHHAHGQKTSQSAQSTQPGPPSLLGVSDGTAPAVVSVAVWLTKQSKPQSASAFVIARRTKVASILTAWHVLHPAPEMGKVVKIELFFDGKKTLIPTESQLQKYEVASDKGADLSLLQVPAGEGAVLQLADSRFVPAQQTHAVALGKCLLPIISPEPSDCNFAGTLQLQKTGMFLAQNNRDNKDFSSMFGGPVLLMPSRLVIGVTIGQRHQPPGFAIASISRLAGQIKEKANIEVAGVSARMSLPPPPENPIARVEERAIQQALDSHPTRSAPFVLLTGPVGVGKSVLAIKIAWARLRAGKYPTGVRYFKVSGAADEELLVQIGAEVLGSSLTLLPDELVEAIQAALSDGRTLVVLDDLNDGAFPQTMAALHLVPVLATARHIPRQPTPREIQQHFPIAGLPPLQANHWIRDELKERIIEETPKNIDRLSARLGYNMLALQIAMRVLSVPVGSPLRPHGTIDNLIHELDIARAQNRAPQPDDPVAAMMEISWGRLEATARQTALAIAHLGETAVPQELVKHAIDLMNVEKELEALSSLGFVERVGTDEVLMNSWARSWALQSVDSKDAKDSERLCDWLLKEGKMDPAKSWQPSLAQHLPEVQRRMLEMGATDKVYRLASLWQFELERHDHWLTLAQLWSRAAAATHDFSSQKTSSLLALGRVQLKRRAYWDAIKAWTNVLTQDQQQTGINPQRWEALNGLSQAYYGAGLYVQAGALAKISVDELNLAGRRGSPPALVSAYYQLSRAAFAIGRHQAARAAADSSAKLAGDLKDPASLSLARYQQGLLAESIGDHDAARQAFRDSLSSAQERNNLPQSAAAIGQLSKLAQRTGNYSEALRLAEQQRDLATDLRDRPGYAAALLEVGVLRYALGNRAGGQQDIDESIGILGQHGDRALISGASLRVAQMELDRGDIARAKKRLAEALTLKQALGDTAGQARVEMDLGRIALYEQQNETAEFHFAGSLVLYKSLSDPIGQAGALNQLGVLAEGKTQPLEAERYYRQSLFLSETTDDERNAALTAWGLARLAEAKKHRADALALATRAALLLLRLRDPLANAAREFAQSLGESP